MHRLKLYRSHGGISEVPFFAGDALLSIKVCSLSSLAYWRSDNLIKSWFVLHFPYAQSPARAEDYPVFDTENRVPDLFRPRRS